MEQRPGGENIQVGDGRIELQKGDVFGTASKRHCTTNRIPTVTYHLMTINSKKKILMTMKMQFAKYVLTRLISMKAYYFLISYFQEHPSSFMNSTVLRSPPIRGSTLSFPSTVQFQRLYNLQQRTYAYIFHVAM